MEILRQIAAQPEVARITAVAPLVDKWDAAETEWLVWKEIDREFQDVRIGDALAGGERPQMAVEALQGAGDTGRLHRVVRVAPLHFGGRTDMWDVDEHHAHGGGVVEHEIDDVL